MSCLDGLNLVGLKDDCGVIITESSTGWYVNDLNIPGLVDTIAAGKARAGANAQVEIENQINLAQRQILAMTATKVGDRFSLRSLLESAPIGYYEPPRSAQAAQAANVGIQIKVIRNPYADVVISRVGLVTQAGGAVTVNAWDLYSGQVLETVEITTVAGIPKYENVAWSFSGHGEIQDIFIGYDATSVATYETGLGNASCSKCNGGSMNLRHLHAYTRKSVGTPQGSLLSQQGTSGLLLNVSLICQPDNLICSYGKSLAPVVYYKAGENLANYLKYSKRINPAIAAYQKQHSELAKAYAKEWQDLFGYMLENIVIPKSDCFKCESRTKIRVSLP